jgi:membrane protein
VVSGPIPSRRGRHLKAVIWAGLKHALDRAIHDVQDHHTLQVAAALSYYFFLALFPGLIVLSALFSSIPTTDLFGWVLVTMGRLLPPETMQLIFSVLADVLSAHRRAWLSFGMLGMLWVATAAFDALIEALNIAYDIKDDRPFWKTRLLALGLAAICGGLFLVGLGVILVGPRFGDWLASRLDIPQAFAALWPFLHWTIAIGFTVLAVELLYFLAPRIKPRFVDTLPGAVLTVGAWLGLSSILGVYFRHFANYSRTYGTLGGFIAFLIWCQWTSFAMLIGAEINTELAKARKARGRERDSAAEKMGDHQIPDKAA